MGDEYGESYEGLFFFLFVLVERSCMLLYLYMNYTSYVYFYIVCELMYPIHICCQNDEIN